MIESELLSLYQKFSKKSLFSRSNSNHLSSSTIFQNRIYFTSNSIILFYLFDCFNISIRKLYESDVTSSQETLISRFNISSTHQHRSYSFCSRVNSKIYLSISTYRFFSFVSKIFSISSQEIDQCYIRIFKIHQSYINTRITLFVRELTQNSVRFSNKSVSLFCSSISSQKVSIISSLKIFLFAFSIHFVSILKSSISFENIAKSYLFYINKNFVSFVSEINRISISQYRFRRLFKSSSTFSIAIILFTREFFDILFVYLAN